MRAELVAVDLHVVDLFDVVPEVGEQPRGVVGGRHAVGVRRHRRATPRLLSATRSRPGGAPTSSRNGRAGGGAKYGDVGSGPAMASSIAALSRTLRDTTCAMA